MTCNVADATDGREGEFRPGCYFTGANAIIARSELLIAKLPGICGDLAVFRRFDLSSREPTIQ